jgi:flagellar basal-body rod protein FlgB
VVPLIDNGLIALTGLALDATTMRHRAIAQNIANANTPGYRPVDVSFETQVRALQSAGGDGTPALRPQLRLAGADQVSLDTQMTQLAENTLHHEALLKALNKQFAIISAAIGEGKR